MSLFHCHIVKLLIEAEVKAKTMIKCLNKEDSGSLPIALCQLQLSSQNSRQTFLMTMNDH